MEDKLIDEEQIISNLILDNDYQDYFTELEDKYFRVPIVKRLFNNAKKLYSKKQLNLNNILLYYKNNVSNEYNDVYKILTSYSPVNVKTIEYFMNSLKDIYLKNNLRGILTDSLNSITPNSSINDIITSLNIKVNKLDTLDEKIDLKANMALTDLFDEIEEIKSGKKSKIRTCIREYDALTGGLKGSEMTIIAGRPGTGKTTFAINLACNIAKNKGKKVYFICLEMSTNQLMSKVLSYESGINSQVIYSGNWNNSEFEHINNAINIINNNYELTFNTQLRYLEDMLYKIKKLKSKDMVDVVIVDYISLISTRTRNQTTRDRVSQISREFKLLSLELDIPIILLSQLNREAQNREPSIADLRESGNCEQDKPSK